MRKNVIEYLEKSVKKHPNKIAFTDVEKSISYSELSNKAKIIATNIIDCLQGKKNQPIAIYLDKGIDAITAFMGVIYSGNFYIPLDIHSPLERINKILDKLQPSLIITYNSKMYINEWYKCLYLDSINNRIDENKLKTIKISQIDTDPLYVMFTSGSTGTPKGVTISQKSVIDYTEWIFDTFKFKESIVFGNQAPLYFDNSVLDIYSTLKAGGTTVFIPDNLFAFPSKLLAFMAENTVNTIFWVPSALTLLTNRKKITVPQELKLEKILFCGEVMPTKTLNRLKNLFPYAYYANLYGPTEITDVCCFYEVDREFKDNDILPIGKACNNTEILLLNEKNMLVAVGEIGEICVRGTCLSLGYYNDKEKTSAVFIQNPLHDLYEDKIYRTGDLAKYDENNDIIFMGRKDSQIKHMGYRIELGEIEASAASLENIKELSVFYDTEKQWIILTCTCISETKELDILKFLERNLPNYMLPSRIFILEELPHTPNGKIDRVSIRNDYYEKRG